MKTSRSLKAGVLTAMLLSTVVACAQPESPAGGRPDSVHYQKPFFALYPKIMIGEKKLSREEANKTFASVPEAALYYRQYRRRYNRGLYSFAGMFDFMAVSTLSLEHNNRPLSAAGLALSVTSFAVSIVFLAVGEGSLKRAVHTYNGSSR